MNNNNYLKVKVINLYGGTTTAAKAAEDAKDAEIKEKLRNNAIIKAFKEIGSVKESAKLLWIDKKKRANKMKWDPEWKRPFMPHLFFIESAALNFWGPEKGNSSFEEVYSFKPGGPHPDDDKWRKTDGKTFLEWLEKDFWKHKEIYTQFMFMVKKYLKTYQRWKKENLAELTNFYKNATPAQIAEAGFPSDLNQAMEFEGPHGPKDFDNTIKAVEELKELINSNLQCTSSMLKGTKCNWKYMGTKGRTSFFRK